MRIELRILSGARSGQSEVFEQQTILVGRKMSNDLRFDANADLDVSAMHAEIVERGSRWFVVDRDSTNGTFVNNVRVQGETQLKDGDIIAFGKHGPTVEVRAKGETTGSVPVLPRTGTSKAAKAPEPERPLSTQERVAIAVRAQTKGMRTTLIGTMVGLGGLAIVAYWMGRQQGSEQVKEMQALLDRAESTSVALREKVGGDTAITNLLARRFDSLRTRAEAAAERGNEVQIAEVKQELEQHQTIQQGWTTLDFSAIHERNDDAIAFLVSELDGKLFGGTAFGITKSGLLVTNRHNVRSTETGSAATRIEIQFANSARRLPARVVKVSDAEDQDLALIQIDQPGSYPAVAGISATGGVRVGSPVVTIGFPFSLDLPMQGNVVKTTLSPGTASKHVPAVLQIDAFGAHGLSGAPVFDNKGQVVGVVFGGPKGETRIVYAVPSDRLTAFIGDLAPGAAR